MDEIETEIEPYMGTTEEIIYNSYKKSNTHLSFGKKNLKYVKKSEWDEHILERNESDLQSELEEERKILEKDLFKSETNMIDYGGGFKNLVFNNLEIADELIKIYEIKDSVKKEYTIPIIRNGDFTKKVYMKINLFKEEDIPNLLESEIKIQIGGSNIFYFPFQLILCINFLTENKIEYDIDSIRIPICLFNMYFNYGLPNISLQYHDIEIKFNNKLEGYDIDFEVLYTYSSSDIRIRYAQIPLENIIMEYNIHKFSRNKDYNIHNSGFLLFDMLYFPNCDSDLIELRISANKGEDYICFDDFLKVHFYNYVFYIIPFCPELRNFSILKNLYKNKFDMNYINFSLFDATYKVIHSGINSDYKLYSIGINILRIMSGMGGKAFAF